MLTDLDLDKYADVLLWALKTARKNPYVNNDNVLVAFDLPALPLVEKLHRKILEMRLNPIIRMNMTASMQKDFYEEASHKQLGFISPGEKELREDLHGFMVILAPESLTHLKHIDPERIATSTIARKPLRDIQDGREDRGDYSWTLCLYPTPALAESAGLTMEEYTQQIRRACYLTEGQPEDDWKRIHGQVTEIKEWLYKLDVESVHVESENTDLHIKIGDRRRWCGVTGHNIPSFEIYTSPDWRGTEGVYYADQPSYRSGNRVEGVRIEFKKGRAVLVEAREGGQFAAQQAGMDEGAGKVGEFSLTDRRFSRINTFMAHTLYDENYGGEFGNCHIAIGSSYSDTFDGDPAALTHELKEELGFNNSALHWDLVNTEDKRVTAKLAGGGTRVIYEGGEFTL